MTASTVSELSKEELSKKIEMKALELGFTKAGFTSAADFESYRKEMESRPGYESWVEGRPYSPYIGAQPTKVMPEAKSIICLVSEFGDIAFPEELSKHIGRMYLNRDYLPKLPTINNMRHQLFQKYLQELGIKVDDSGVWLPERMTCARAGVVTFGGNNFAYTKESGSFIVLASYLVDAELVYSTPTMQRDCSPNCEKCIEACPTGALSEAGKLSIMKCRLALQVNKVPFSEETCRMFGESLHGCDLCQTACPRNQKVMAKASRVDPFLEKLVDDFDLEKVLLLDDDYYESVVKPIMYNYIVDLTLFQRNAAIVMGNEGNARYLPALRKARGSCDEYLAEFIDWAIEQCEVTA